MSVHVRGAGPMDRLNVSIIVSKDDGSDPRLVGAILHPNREVILGTMPGTSAAKLPERDLEALLGMRMATPEEIEECNQGPPPLLGTGVLDGSAQIAALDGLT